LVLIDSFYVILNFVFMYYYLAVNSGNKVHIVPGVPLKEEGFNEWIELSGMSKIIARICGSICVLTMVK